MSSGVIAGSRRGFPWSIWLFAALWNALVAALVWIGLQPSSGGAPVFGFLAICGLAAVGAYLVYKAVAGTLQHSRFGDLSLVLDRYPPAAGGELAGTLSVPVAFDTAFSATAKLVATEYSCVRVSREMRSYDRPLFEEQATAEVEAAAKGTRLRFRFRLPAEAPPSVGHGERITWTEDTIGRVFVHWRLSVTAKLAGADLEETFDIPVVAASLMQGLPDVSSSAPLAEASAASLPERQEALRSEPVATGAPPPGALELPEGHNPGYEYEREGETLRVVQPAWRKPGTIGSPNNIALGVGMCSVFTVLGLFLMLGNGNGYAGAAFFVFGTGFTAAMLAILGHTLAVEIRPHELRITRSFGPLVFKNVTLRREEIVSVEAAAESIAQQAGATLTRAVLVHTHSGQSHYLAELLARRSDALALRDLVVERLSLGSFAAEGNAAVAAPKPAAARPTGAPGEVRRSSNGLKYLGGLAITAVFLWLLWPAAKLIVPPAEPPKPGAAMPVTPVLAPQPQAPPPMAPREAIPPPQATARLQPASTQSSPATVQVQVDDEAGLRRLAGQYWDKRDYAQAYAHYERAYAAVTASQLDEAARNLRLAQNAAGIMASACMLGKWDVSDRAMAELKERFPGVNADAQRALKYWIDTGEPRLKARKC